MRSERARASDAVARAGDTAARSGASLVELVTAMTLSSLVMALAAATCFAQLRLARATAERAASTDAMRTATAVIEGEARRMTRDDVRAAGADSIDIRAFRGTGIVCDTATTDILVRYTGDRLPDASKDSVVALAGGPATTVALVDSKPAPGQCATAPGEDVLEWTLGGDVSPGAVLLVFESGSYHLSGNALRYRAGAAGRQPLTAEAFRHPATRFTSVSGHGIGIDIHAGDLVARSIAPYAPAAVR